MIDAAGDVGCYEYFLNGERVDIEETFEITTGPDHTRRIVSIRRVPAAATTLRVDAQVASGEVVAAQVAYRAPDAGATAEYQMLPGELRVSRRLNSQPLEQSKLSLREPGCLFPLLRVFSGMLVTWLLQRGGSGQVVTPWIVDPGDHDRLLSAHLDQRVVQATTRGRPDDLSSTADGYLLTGGPYKDGAEYWLGESGEVVRYRWQQSADQHWDVRLASPTA